MNVERLAILAEFLTTVQEDKFDLKHWRIQNSEPNENSTYAEIAISDKQLIKGCNTAACAMGWACTIPEFKKAGLSFCTNEENIVLRKTIPNKNYKRTFYGYEAAEYFFGFKETTTVYCLFSPTGYIRRADPRGFREVNKLEVIERINKLISLNKTQVDQHNDELAFLHWCNQQNEKEAEEYYSGL